MPQDLGVSLGKYRLAVAHLTIVSLQDPFDWLVRMTPFGPPPKQPVHGLIHFREGVFGGAEPVVVRPSPYLRVEVSYHLSSGTLPMLPQVGFEASEMADHLVLLRPCQQFVFEPLNLEPQEVKPVRDVHHSGFDFIEL